jgi:zinc protease
VDNELLFIFCHFLKEEHAMASDFLDGYRAILTAFCFLAVLCLFMAPAMVWAWDAMDGLHKFMLPNGITAIVKSSRRAPVVAVQVWVKAGSIYETDAEAGITHLIEHMIFKGTKKRGPGEVARSIEAVGGSINAYTSLDYTVYHCEVPRSAMEEAVDVLADAVFNSVFDSMELEREKKVVLEELRMREDRPMSRMSRLLMETSYTKHPYRRPVIGYEYTVSSFTRDDILNYMKRRYLPENITVVVVGDVTPQQVQQVITQKFATYPKEQKAIASEPDLVEPPQQQVRIKQEKMETEEGYLAISFSGVPGFNDPVMPVLDVMSSLLANGTASRLNRVLREEKQLVHTISASAFTPKGPGLFEIFATLDPEKMADAIENILKELAKLQQGTVSVDELERAKVAVEKGFVEAMETMDGEADKIGSFEIMFGDPRADVLYLKRIREVAPEDIKRAAQHYFVPEHINIVTIVPRDTQLDLKDEVVQQLIKRSGLIGFNDKDNSSIRLLPVERYRLPNGVIVMVRENHDVPTVAVQAVFPGGLRYETKDTNGIFHFMEEVWTRGTQKHSYQELSEIIEGLGGSIHGFSGKNTFGLSGHFLSKYLDKSLDIFIEILLSPVFLPSEVEKVRPLILAELKRQEDSLSSVAFREFNRVLFAPHPYALNPIGSTDVVQSIQSKDLFNLYKEYVTPDQAVISVVGDVNAKELFAKLQGYLGAWSVPRTKMPSIPLAPAPLLAPKPFNLVKDKQQTHIVLGFPGVNFKNPDRYALEVLNAALAGQGGRLFLNLRDKDSLAYAVTSMLGLGLDYGSIGFYIACAPEKKDQAINAMWKEIYAVLQNPLTNEEVERAKAWLIGNYEISMQTNEAQAMDIVLNEIYGLGWDFPEKYVREIQAVDAAKVLDVAQRYLHPDRYVLVTIGK